MGQLVVAVDQRIRHRQDLCAVRRGRLHEREGTQQPAGRGEQRLALRAGQFWGASHGLVQYGQVGLLRALLAQGSPRRPPAKLGLLVGVVRPA
ncbi:hypothetical protein OG301_17060 [Streptomyces platensis]|uniref:hypothetical protein n=1 Tax=Streptomyces platensis TaxID=58346 RepID=UPI002E81FBEA|nr:hypothetical protein [Streptomyces platensis]WTI52952.1 hypothetical protein OG301_17060 [Streptomyces platensis]WUB81439.1 hypothetical protein OG424_21000 [Streptomyces platensis]